jgi:hypothetical protein
MNDFAEDFVAHILGDNEIVAVIGTRIFPETIPQKGAIPAITYRIISGQLSNSLDGFTSGLVNYHVQVDCWARTFETARRLALLVRNRANTRHANFGSWITEYPGEDEFEDDTKRYRRMVNLSCWHHENT